MIKKYISYLPFALIFGFLLLMQFSPYEKVDQLPILRGQGISWSSNDLKTSIIKAEREDKLIFVNFYATWCRPCKMLKSVTFTRESVAEVFNKNFVNIALDIDSSDGQIIANKYKVRSYPTLLILDTNGLEIGRKEGFMLPFQLNTWAKETLQ